MMAASAVATAETASAPMSPLTEMMMGRLQRALGPAKTKTVSGEIFRKMGVSELSTPQDLCDFANHLIPYGGVAEAVGRSLKVMALLRSAVDRPVSPRA